MLARSSSTPILNSWIHSHSCDLSSPEHDFHLPKLVSVATQSEDSKKKMTRARSETDLRDLALHKRSSINTRFSGFVKVEEEESSESDLKSSYVSIDHLFSSSGLDELVEEEEESCIGGGIGFNGGKFNGGNGDGFSEYSDSYNENEKTDAYYQKMIKSDPGNGLVLGNYAKFLKEVRGDLVKAEEYCERAILANPNDGNVKSLYANLVWEVHRDASRAEKYFDQAVQAEPNDCYVMASYAHFLWDAEEDEDEEEEEEEEEEKRESEIFKSLTKPPDLFHGVQPPVSAY